MKRKVCVITGSRAEYGLLRPLMREIKRDKKLKLQLVVTGMHLSREFGSTYREILKDRFKIDRKINLKLNSDTPKGISNSMALAQKGFIRAYHDLKPDIVVVLGDRYEIFSAVIPAVISNLPVAHIDGGELTEGAIDDALRHSITKMSCLHFTSTAEYRKRVIQLGEHPSTVYNVGALALDSIKSLKLLTRSKLEKELKFKLNRDYYLTTFHPVTKEKNSGVQFKNLLMALDGMEDTSIILTKANADPGGRQINRMIDSYVRKNRGRAAAFTSMGQLRYFSAMKYASGVVGNSSSGIIEPLNFNVGTINIGTRQKGRVRAKSIIDCNPTKRSITNAFKKLKSKSFRKGLKRISNPYGSGDAARKIVRVLKKFNFEKGTKKSFYNL